MRRCRGRAREPRRGASGGRRGGRGGRAAPPATVEIVAAVKYVTRTTCPRCAEAGITPRRREPHRPAGGRSRRATATLFRWDFIGHLQSRKARDVVGRVRARARAVRESAARQIDARSERPQDVLVEVNTAADPSKYGVAPDDLDAFLELLAGLDDVRVRGLMTMPALAETPRDRGRRSPRCASWPPAPAGRWAGTHAFDVALDGHRQDFAVAVEEGATVVRLGSVLLGRPTDGALDSPFMGVRDLWHRTLVYFGLGGGRVVLRRRRRRHGRATRTWNAPTASGRTCRRSTGAAAARATSTRSTREEPRPSAPPSRRRRATSTRRSATAAILPGATPSARAGDDRVRVHVIAPRSFNDAQQIADRFKTRSR